jgi:hypothetical protein
VASYRGYVVRAGHVLDALVRLAYFVYALLVLVNSAYAKMETRLGRPEIYPVKKVIGFDQEMIKAIEDWRKKQKPMPNVSDAIRRLVELGLKGKRG